MHMEPSGRPTLRDQFDEAVTPLIGHPPRTHHLDYYMATDGSFRTDGGGLGAVIETRDGITVERISQRDVSPDNNVAEYRALHLGLDVLATRVPPKASIGILVDHAELARHVNAASLVTDGGGQRPPVEIDPPVAAARHWRGIRARLATFGSVRAARIDSSVNPAHPLANETDAFAHLSQRPGRCVLPDPAIPPSPDAIPPPSRANRRPSD